MCTIFEVLDAARANGSSSGCLLYTSITEPTEGHGPPLEMRLPPELVVTELEEAGFSASVLQETLPRHYIVVGRKP